MSEATLAIYCCGCKRQIEARLTSGAEIYPHRDDLGSLPFWRCDACGNYVGCHHKTANRTRPLGNIPTKELRDARQHIHRLIDPIWQRGRMSRGKIYAVLAKDLGLKEYHTAEIETIEEAREAYVVARRLSRWAFPKEANRS